MRERALAISRVRSQHRATTGLTPESRAASSQGNKALQRPAVERARRGLALAEELSHVESMVIANHFAAHLHQLRGEASSVQERAERMITLAGEYGLELRIAFGHMNLARARVEHGQIEEGIQELQRRLTAYDAAGAKLWRAHFLGLLALALAGAGRVEEGLAAVTEALALVQHTADNCSGAELPRIHGELLIRQSIDAAAGGTSRTPSPAKIPPAVASRHTPASMKPSGSPALPI